MADYNQWMNANIYVAAAKLKSVELTRERGAFFGSIFGTLNHILVGDTIWLKRFGEHSSALGSLDPIRNLNLPASLDVTLYPKFDDLREARVRMDEIIINFSLELTDSILETTLDYKNTKGVRFKKPMGALIQHFFNHQTHHRGQVSTLLSQSGTDIGVTDLLARIPN